MAKKVGLRLLFHYDRIIGLGIEGAGINILHEPMF